MSDLGVGPRVVVSDKRLFLLFFVVGSFLMFLAKEILAANQYIVSFFPLAAMLIYYFVSTSDTILANKPERAGDNIYYLGFLYTLISLSLALYHFGSENGATAKLIGDFAIALSTTVAGVLGRVMLSQGSVEVDVYEQEARVYLADAVDELRNQLAYSRDSLSVYSEETLEMLRENRDKNEESLRVNNEIFYKKNIEMLAGCSKAIMDVSDQVVRDIRDGFNSSFSTVSSEVDIFLKNVSSFNKSLKLFVEKIEMHSDAFDALVPLDEQLKTVLSDIMRPIAETNIKIDEMSRVQVRSADVVIESASKISAASVSISKSLEGVDSICASLSSSVLNLENTLHDTVSSFRNEVQAMSKIPEELSGASSAFIGSLGSVKVDVNSFSENINSLDSYFDSRKSLQDAVFIKEKEFYDNVSAHRQDVLNAYVKLDSEAASTLESLQSRVDLASKALLDVAEYIAQGVKA